MKIVEHDLAVKVNHMWEFLEKKHSAKLWVKTKVQREEHLAAERKKQLRMLEEVAEFGGCGCQRDRAEPSYIGTDWCAHLGHCGG